MSDELSRNSSSGRYHPTPSAVVHEEVRLKSEGTGTPHWATIAGSPQAPPSAAAGWVLRRDWPATVSGRASTSRWQTAWSAAVSRRVGMLTGSLPQAASSSPRQATTPADVRAPRARTSGLGRDEVPANVWSGSDVDDRAGERTGDPVEVLHLRDDELAQLVDVARLGAHDHVVRAGDVLGQGHALHLGDGAGHVGCLPDVGLDEDVRLYDHGCLLRENEWGPVAWTPAGHT